MMGAAVGGERACRISFQPVGRRVEVAPGATVLAAAQAAGVEIVSICGGAGLCGACRVRWVGGALAPPTPVETEELTDAEREAGWRLACQAQVQDAVQIDVPPESLAAPQRLQVEGQQAAVAADPLVHPIDLVIPPPDLDDLRADASRLQDALGAAGHPPVAASLPVLATLPGLLRRYGWRARLVVRGAALVAILPYPDEGPIPPGRVAPSQLLGLAVDVGTTKVAAYLVDLADGRTLAQTGAMNPQIAYGEDVVSRIAYANTHADGRALLQRRLVETLNGMVDTLCRATGAAPAQVVEAVAVGNTAMHHLLAGLPVAQLGEAPYVPAVSQALEIPAASLGLVLAPGAYVYLPPNIAGYVGADHVAMLLVGAAPLVAGATPRTIIALDIGTNTEISLLTGDRILCCSCASGPAFEGAHIRDGMRAAPGAVERVHFADGVVQVSTIDGQPAVGLCGSGILDAVAAMLDAGVVDRRGALRRAPVGEAGLVRGADGKPVFVLVPARRSGTGRDVGVTRSDVNEIQLAKGAIRAGVDVLLDAAGLRAADLDEFVVAGAFGTYLNLRSAVRVGMFPDLPPARFRQIGNAAGAGARALLVSARQRAVAEAVARRIEYVELTTHPGFTAAYMDALGFRVGCP